jgi:N-methylhydantoinase B
MTTPWSSVAPGFFNAPYSATASALSLTSLMLINPDIPRNTGMLRPIHIANPGGSFLNARFPGATTFGNSVTGLTSDAIFRAFPRTLLKNSGLYLS